jgi:hypothetical protein
MNKHCDSIDAAILARIRTGAKNRVWTAADFLDLGSRAAVDKALSRNCRTGYLRRAGRGLYHQPRRDPLLGDLGPDFDAWNDLLRRKAGADVLPSGAHAANALGLSDQVPMRPFYVTAGRAGRLRNGRSTTVLRHVSPRFVSTKNPVSARVILALRWIGKRHVDADTVAKLRRNISRQDRASLAADVAHAPAWIADIFRDLARDTTQNTA